MHRPVTGISKKYLMLALAFLAGCHFFKQAPDYAKTGELVFATVNGPSTYYEDPQGNIAGLEYDLANLFAQSMGLKAKFVVAENEDQVEKMVKDKKVNLAAAGLAIDPEENLLFSSPYFKVQPQLVYNVNSPKPANLSDLSGKTVEYPRGYHFSAFIAEARQSHPDIRFSEMKTASSEDLLGRVSDGFSDYTVSYSNQIDISKNFHPNIGSAFDAGKPLELAWAYSKDEKPELLQRVNSFFEAVKKDGTLDRLVDRYYGHVFRLEQADVLGFLAKLHDPLDKFRPYFEEAEDLTGIDWRLLAALAYQESHWDEHATSPTGVRGLMMLTTDTADSLNVSDRLNARESILGGARYLLSLKDSIPVQVHEPDRTWFALAAYNVGTGHLEDARVLAEKMKLNPNSWSDLKDSLPLLSRPSYFRSTKHGFARGGEAVIMVGSIRSYYDILCKQKQPHFPDLMRR